MEKEGQELRLRREKEKQSGKEAVHFEVFFKLPTCTRLFLYLRSDTVSQAHSP